MPQITVNEIDQSVVTRVVSDDKVKILIPAILSFGPTYDETNNSVMTFTDLSAFNRGCGYTPAEFNPFENDYSRIYARELLKKGAAVSVVRVNNMGNTSDFIINGSDTDRTKPSVKTIAPAVLNSVGSKDKVYVSEGVYSIVQVSSAKTITLTYEGNSVQVVPNSLKAVIKVGDTTNTYVDDGKGKLVIEGTTTTIEPPILIDYTTGIISGGGLSTATGDAIVSFTAIINNSAWKYTFCPQVDSITAKYPGSFGNKLFISISQITTANLAESYQYANISVYYVDREINYTYNSTTQKAEIKSQVVSNVTLLETKRVSTNPNDAYYFEDVEFDFIKINGVANAREQLTLVWSNIEGSPTSELMYSGFPTIALKYVAEDGFLTYNFDANFGINIYGTDFNYSQETIEKLKAGFKGYTSSSTTSYVPSTSTSGNATWTVSDINKYLEEVYGVGTFEGIKAQIFKTISSTYDNFADPYIYDFDFITSGGFVYEEYKLSEVTSEASVVSSEIEVVEGNTEFTLSKLVVPETFSVTLADGTTYKESGGNVSYTYSDSITKITFSDVEISFDDIASSTYTYYVDTKYVTDSEIPITSGNVETITLSNAPIFPKSVSIVVSSVSTGSGTYVDNGEGSICLLGALDTSVGTINYDTGVVTFNTAIVGATGGKAVPTYTYFTASKQYAITVPIAANSGEYSYYEKITPIHASMLNLVNTRQDCIALFDVPKDYDKTAIIEYSAMLNTSYGTMHNPWCWVASPDISGQNILMAPSYIFLYTFLQNLDNNADSQKWFPPAGVKRATARVVKKPYYEIGSVILNAWQNDNISRVNPIMRLKQYGYVIYGQYTTLQAIDLYTHSALESLNVRLISNVVKKKIFDVCLNLAFEPNTENLWNKFFAQMDEFLRYMQYNEGVYAYRIVMDKSTVTTDDINHLRCPGKVYIAPTRTAEFFDIDFIITEAGALFNN